VGPATAEEELRTLIDEYRARCLWWLREDYYPKTAAEQERVLRLIERHGDSRAGHHTLLVEWARDSAFRFFPLVEHDELGLTLHPFDLATNKVLARVGRLEVRDWIDLIACDERIQPLGYLVWAACGKDPGFTPQEILHEARRSSRYSDEEIASLAFDGRAPTAGDLSRRWRTALDAAARTVDDLPAEHVCEADTHSRRGVVHRWPWRARARARARGRQPLVPSRPHRGRLSDRDKSQHSERVLSGHGRPATSTLLG